MKFQVGDVIKIYDGRIVVITHRYPHESVLRDGWMDYDTKGVILKNFMVTKTEIRFSTDVMLRDATIIGKAEIYTVVGNMQIGGLDEAPYYRLP